jgi:long-chain acyl-CoA synthetase
LAAGGRAYVNLANVIEGHPADSVAFVDGDQTMTYGELRESVAQRRRHLHQLGIVFGSVVTVAAGNEVSFAVSALAVLGLGGIVMPVNPLSPPPELQLRIDLVQSQLMLIGAVGATLLEHDFGVTSIDMTAAVPDDLPDDLPDDRGVVDQSPGATAFYMLTSGVSGEPKVVVLTHANLSWIHEALDGNPEPMSAADVTLGCLPFAHIFGLNVVLLASLRAGSSIVLQRRFDVDESLRLVRKHRITMLTGAPPMWQRWAKADAPDDSLATVRHAASGAAALPLGVFEAVRDRYGIEIAQGYGLTETSPIVTLGRGHPVRPSSVGKVLEGVEVALVDGNGVPVDIGDEGEVVVRSPGVFQGYLNDAEMTDSVLTADGWFWTGDVGIFDEDGYLYLVDRIKDVVIVSGFNVFPAEVETVLMSHPDVTGAIVTGTADERTGETVVAHVAGAVDEADLRAHVARQLSRHKCPREYHFLDELPIAPNGKPIRRALR